MQVDRRNFIHGSLALAGLAALPGAARAGAAREPILYRVVKGAGTVHMLGFSEATNNDWFVPKIAAALDAADTLWLETPPGSASAAAAGESSGPPVDPELQRIFAERALDPAHDLFEVLPPAVSARTGQWADKLKLTRNSLAPMRPWFARITIQQAYAAQRQTKADEGEKTVFPERVVIDRARQRGIPIQSEYSTLADLLRFFAELSEAAQPQYLEELFDYFDRDVAGTNDAGKYGWITGQPSTQSIDEQRERTPDLYRAMHVERNAWWTGRIEGMLEAGGSSFIMIGGNHVLGPDSIPVYLRKRGLKLEEL
jgi:uncharacterized protein YbaP (TraB family)